MTATGRNMGGSLKIVPLAAVLARLNANAALNELNADRVLLGRQGVSDLLHLRVGLRQQVGVEVLASGERSLNVLNGQRQKRIAAIPPRSLGERILDRVVGPGFPHPSSCVGYVLIVEPPRAP